MHVVLLKRMTTGRAIFTRLIEKCLFVKLMIIRACVHQLHGVMISKQIENNLIVHVHAFLLVFHE